MIPWYDGHMYLTRRDLVIASGLKDPDHKNRTDRFKRQVGGGREAFIELDETYFEELNRLCPSVHRQQFAYRKDRPVSFSSSSSSNSKGSGSGSSGGGDVKFIKLYHVDYLNYLLNRPRIEFKRRKKRKEREEEEVDEGSGGGGADDDSVEGEDGGGDRED